VSFADSVLKQFDCIVVYHGATAVFLSQDTTLDSACQPSKRAYVSLAWTPRVRMSIKAEKREVNQVI